MDLIQFKAFLTQLVSLQAAGLDAQHLIDEADKGGYERAKKEFEVKDPVVGLPVGGVPTHTGFTQEQMDQYAADKVALAIAALPADVTPFAQTDIDKAVSESSAALKTKVSELEVKLSQKDTDVLEEAIANELAAMAQKLRDRTVKSAPVVEPVPSEPQAHA